MKIRNLHAFGSNLILAGILMMTVGLTGCQPETNQPTKHTADYGYIQIEVSVSGPAAEIKRLSLNINYYWYTPEGARTDVSSRSKAKNSMLEGLVWQEHIEHRFGLPSFSVHVIPTSSAPHVKLSCKVRIIHDSQVDDTHDEKTGDPGSSVICQIDKIDHKK